MKLLINIVLATTLALSVLLSISSVSAEESKSSSNNTTPLDVSSSSSSNSSQLNKTTDTREKRMLSGFGTNFHQRTNYYSNVPKAAQPAQRRSGDSAGGYPYNSNYDFKSLLKHNINNNQHLHNHLTNGPHDFVATQLSHYRANKQFLRKEDGFNQHSANSYYGHGPQYIEAPEPIIEIIIKDSNDTLPYAAPLISSPKKKKKEEVQVYYVKYKHDQRHGLQVDVPVPAIAPKVPGESHEELDEHPEIVTLPPVKQTTIRAIIHPESEKFHAHGNVRVSFGGPAPRHENHARQITEYNREESALQPVLAHPNSPNSVIDEAAYSKHDQYFDIQGRVVNNFNHVNQVQPPQKPAVNFNVNQVLPPQKPPVNFHPQGQQHFGQARPQFAQSQPQFNPPPPPTQGHQQFHFHHHPQQQQNQRPSFQQGPPPSQQFFNGQRGQFPPHQLQVPTKQAVRFNSQPTSKFQFGQQPQPQKQNFQTHQPRPIPIPLHSVQQNNQQQSQFSNVRFNQPFQTFPSQQQQQQQPQQVQPRPEPPRPTETRPSAHPLPTRAEQTHFQTEEFIQNNHHQQQQQHQQPQTTSVHQGLVQQQAPQNLAQQNPQLREHLQHLQYVLPAGGELVASIPSYEQHITETVQNSPQRQQFNQQQHFHHQNQQPQGSHSFRQEVTPPPLIQKQVQSGNIGPLAHSIGHLSVNDRPVQEFQRLPQHSQQQQNFNNNGPQRFPESSGNNFHQQFDNRQVQQNHPQQQSQLRVQHESVPLRNTFSVPFNHHAVEPLRDPSEQPLSSFVGGQQEPRHPFPNSLPLLQRPKPGQSVSTKYSDLFPETNYNNQQFQGQSNQQFQGQSNQGHFSQNHNGGHFIQSPTTTTTTTTTTTPKPETTTRDYNADLPDEVPPDLREQLLSSGILANSQITVLDYDKLGDTSLQDLPPEHLANFFSHGGAAQIGASEKFETIVKPDGEKVAVQYAQTVKKHPQYKNSEKTLPKKEKVDLKVVRFDTNAQKQTVPEKYIDPEANVLPTVDLNDQVYNRYLPLKINGAQFPIPDVAELKGRRISSVVVLAPVDNPDVAEERSDGEEPQQKQIKFIAGDALKQLIKKPSTENYKKWLEREGKTDVDLQSVVLLVTKNDAEEQEIFMYDIATKAVNKLSGELSSAFVNVAESNVTTPDIDGAAIQDSGIVEQVKSEDTTEAIEEETEAPQPEEEVKEEYSDMKESSVEYDTDMDMGDDASAEGSENIETVVKFDAPIAIATKNNDQQPENQVMISSGYSVIKS